MPRATKIPALRAPATDSTKELQTSVKALTEALDVRLGRRGDPLDRAVTVRELIDSGLAKKLVSRPFNPNNPLPDFLPVSTVVLSRPPAPTGVLTSPAMRTITVFWDQPAYAGHSYAEIWRYDADTIGDAVLIGTSPGTSYIDYTGAAATYYYWVRFVNTGNVTGEFNSTSGTVGTTAADAALLLDLLNGAISESQLVTDLNTRLNGIEDNATNIETNTVAIDGVLGQYTVKIDVNGRVAGFGLANTAVAYDGGIHSEFAVLADRFVIVNTSDDGDVITPFIVTTVPTTLNGVSVPAGVYISDAFIKNGAISTAKIGLLQVDTAQIAELAVSTAKIDNLAVTEAKINSLAVTSAKIADAAITTAKIGDLSVDTIKITGNAVSQTGYASAFASTSASLVFPARGGTVMLWAVIYPTGTTARTFSIKKDGVALKSQYISSLTSWVGIITDTPGTGDVTYSAECSISANLVELTVLEVLK